MFLFALLVLGTRGGDPAVVLFDEAHYVRWGREIAEGRLFTNDLHFEFLGKDLRVRDAPVNAEHPPLAKHMIAFSLERLDAGHRDLTWDQYHLGCERATKEGGADNRTDPPCPPGVTWAGCDKAARESCASDAFAWRLPSIIMGASAAAAIYLIGLRLFGTVTAGLAATSLLLLDNLWYLQSRVALLDIFPAALTLWAFALALSPSWTSRVLSILPMGAAMGSKFTGFFLLPAFLLVHFLRAPRGHPTLRLAIAATLGFVLPMAAFVATYAPYLDHWNRTGGPEHAIGQLMLTIGYALSIDYGFTFNHSYASHPITWIPHIRPTFYYWPKHPTVAPPYMYAVGNVVTWWTATAALLIGPLVLWQRHRRRRHGLTGPPRSVAQRFQRWAHGESPWSPHLGFLLACLLFLASFLPWFLLARTTFNYYATLNVPYFALILAGIWATAWHHSARLRSYALGFMGLAGFWFFAWWPMVSGAEVPAGYFEDMRDLVPWF